MQLLLPPPPAQRTPAPRRVVAPPSCTAFPESRSRRLKQRKKLRNQLSSPLLLDSSARFAPSPVVHVRAPEIEDEEQRQAHQRRQHQRSHQLLGRQALAIDVDETPNARLALPEEEVGDD